MGLIEILLFGVGLSADAFAVSISEGLHLKEKNLTHALRVALFFGLFQALMPVIGFYIGDLMRRIPFLEPAVDWIAFGLLFFAALKMLIDTISAKEKGKTAAISSWSELVLLAVATSIDAMTVGITFAAKDMLLFQHASKDVNVLFASALIGVTTFLISLVGVSSGRLIGKRFGQRAEIFGGIVLLLLALKILLENCGVPIGF